MENIMIIVPHEDDEILMTAGIIERAVNGVRPGGGVAAAPR